MTVYYDDGTIKIRSMTEEDILGMIETGFFVYSVGVRFKTYRDLVRELPNGRDEQ